MKILAIETSFDETAIAIAEFSRHKERPQIKVLSNIISSQVKLHAKYGGVVPNLAKREHQKNLVPLLLQALGETGLLRSKTKSQKSLQTTNYQLPTILEREPELLKQFKKYILPVPPPRIDTIAVTYGPGLAPALWVGVNFAKALAYLWGKPLIPVNHMAGHLYSSLLTTNYKLKTIKFPALALLVSGGHTELVLMRGHPVRGNTSNGASGKFKILGETLDDAAGEAFDKVARILGLKYPGGPEISKLAEKGDAEKYKLPRPMIGTKDYNFSFSGLKTAVLYFVRDNKRFSKNDLAASFEKAVVDVLISKTLRAAKEYNVKTILLGGGVAANKLLREELIKKLKLEVPKAGCWMPEAALAGDNALMISLAAYFIGKKKAWNKVHADANVRLDSETDATSVVFAS